jgi:hypothetical protein
MTVLPAAQVSSSQEKTSKIFVPHSLVSQEEPLGVSTFLYFMAKTKGRSNLH